MKVIITEEQLKKIIESEALLESKHNTKELKMFFSWCERYMGCFVKPTKNGTMVCPPITIKMNCHSLHRSDKGIFDLQRSVAKWFGVTKHEVDRAFKESRPVNLP